VLDRQWKCTICSTKFAHYQKEEIVDHISEHQAREKLDGVCIWCGDSQWGFWSTAKKQTHLRQHIEKENTLKMKNFWDAHDCPACNKSFKDMKPEDIVAHCINQHSPWTVPYCDKCGLNEYDCIELHRSHHERTCRQRPDEPEGSKGHEFCAKCGKDTSLQTPAEYDLHQRDCHPTGKWFCQVCGFEITGFSGPAVHAHNVVCKRPGGRKKTYCRKCGQRVEGIDRVDWHYHDQTCWKSRDPEPDDYRLQLGGKLSFIWLHFGIYPHLCSTYLDPLTMMNTDLQRQKEAIAQLNAQWTSKQDYVRCRTEKFEQGRASLEEEKKAVERSKAANQELRERLEEQLSTVSAAQQGQFPPEPKNLGKCSFHGCDADVGPMNRQQLYNHLALHARETQAAAQNRGPVKFSCPLKKDNGHICSETLDTSSIADFGVHLVHKFSASAQQQVVTVKEGYRPGTNRDLRDAMKRLRERTELGKGLPEPTSSTSQPQDAHHHVVHQGPPSSTQTTLSPAIGPSSGPQTSPRRPTASHRSPTTAHSGGLGKPTHHPPTKTSNQSPSKPSARPSRQHPIKNAHDQDTVEEHPPFPARGETTAASNKDKGKGKATSGDGAPMIKTEKGIVENTEEETAEPGKPKSFYTIELHYRQEMPAG
jgi:hypothetical protein